VKKVRALVVDDNEQLCENTREILEGLEGYDVECRTAAGYHAALSVCDELGRELDLALVDLRLPDGDGLELVAELHQRCPYAAAVIITGDATVESAAAAVGKGAFAYLLKPYRAPDLLRKAALAFEHVALLREREALRTDLERSERQHRLVVDAIPAFVMALDELGNISLWNQRLEEITGHGRGEMIGRAGLELIGTGGDRILPVKSGGHRLVRWQLAKLGDAPGTQTTYAVGIDVTNERDMLRRTLRAERLAAVGTLATGLAHEVRNPLNSATLQLQVLRRRIERPAAERQGLTEIVEVVEQEIRRLDRLVSDFLAFARPHPLHLRSASLDELVSAVVEQLRLEVESGGMTLEVELRGGDARAEVDPERLRQVLINLVKNAIDSMGAGGVLTVRTSPSDREGNLAIQVEDTGVGFPNDAAIFDAFYTTKEGGTGLGLAIVHRIVQEHGGAVSAESRPGCTCFTVRLPASTRAGPPTVGPPQGAQILR
jgi:signal transduction histidine kinase